MKQYKEHKYQQPKGDKYCVLYNIANVFDLDLTFLNGYKSDGIGTKDMEYIIQSIGYPKSYLAVLSNTIYPNLLQKDVIQFIINSIRKYTKPDRFAVLPTVITTKTGGLHAITILLSLNKIIVSDPRKTHMIEVTLDELISVLNAQQIAALLDFKGYRQHRLITIEL